MSIFSLGEMAERLKVPDSKSGVWGSLHRGFESPSLRHYFLIANGVYGDYSSISFSRYSKCVGLLNMTFYSINRGAFAAFLHIIGAMWGV